MYAQFQIDKKRDREFESPSNLKSYQRSCVAVQHEHYAKKQYVPVNYQQQQAPFLMEPVSNGVMVDQGPFMNGGSWWDPNEEMGMGLGGGATKPDPYGQQLEEMGVNVHGDMGMQKQVKEEVMYNCGNEMEEESVSSSDTPRLGMDESNGVSPRIPAHLSIYTTYGLPTSNGISPRSDAGSSGSISPVVISPRGNSEQYQVYSSPRHHQVTTSGGRSSGMPSPNHPVTPAPSPNFYQNNNNLCVGQPKPICNSGPTIEKLLEDVKMCLKLTETLISQSISEIMVLALPFDEDITTNLIQLLQQRIQITDSTIDNCNLMETKTILHCKHLQLLCNFIAELKQQRLQMDLLIQELKHYISPKYHEDFFLATLYIKNSPFPATVKQHMPVDPIEVRLITTCRMKYQVTGPVQAELLSDWTIGNKKTPNPIQGDEEYLSKGTAFFNHLKFTVGTACKMVNLKFRVAIRYNNKQVTIESQPTEPFIVMTNTKQWDETQGLLLRKYIFREKKEVPTAQFCNIIQYHFLQATRQDPLKAIRPLCPEDFHYFFTSKLSKPFHLTELITFKDFDLLWSWLGPCLQKIRYHKYIAQMWKSGIFWGFVSKADTERILTTWGVGTFLLRFSERFSDGSMAIAYKQNNTDIRHYLIRAKDISGQGKSLPQFIRETQSLLQFLSFSLTDRFDTQFVPIEKLKALEKIGKKKKVPDTKGDGYDSEVLELGFGSMTV